MDILEDLVKLLLPDFLVDHFTIIKVEEIEGVLHIDFEEKNSIPQEFSTRSYQSNGFHSSISIEDFPLRGKQVLLHVKRRRWIDKNTGEILQRNWSLIAKGTRMTQDFAEFLKKIGRY
jgi:hypothetical protein